jgi:hypothetical protein
LCSITSTHLGARGFVGSARERDELYRSRTVVFRRVKGEEGVGWVSRRRVHGMGSGLRLLVGGVEEEEGNVSVGPRCRAPPVRGDGLKGFASVCPRWAGCFGCMLFGGSRVRGNKLSSGTGATGTKSALILPCLSNRSRTFRGPSIPPS